MRRHERTIWLLTVVLLVGALIVPAALAQVAGGEWAITEQDDNRIVLERDSEGTPAPEATATPTPEPPTATATSEPEPTATEHEHPSGTPGFHQPGAHDGLNVHEHGDPVPQWVTDSDWTPFTQDRESHTGYKGVYDESAGDVESYFIAHILATEAARAHGDHDYQLWVRDPDSGAVFYWDGVLCFAQPCTAPIIETTDEGFDRSDGLALGERHASDGCETWYSAPGVRVIDVGWTICGRYQAFDGTVLGGVGTTRTIDWILYPTRLSGAARDALADDCVVEFGVCRMGFLVNTRSYAASGIEPVN